MGSLILFLLVLGAGQWCTKVGSIFSASADTQRLDKIKCRPDQFWCWDGACRNASQRCNGVKDCSEGEDEGGCPTESTPLPSTQHPPAVQHCQSDQFRCHNGHCISKTFYCDGKKDCPTGEDEYCAPATPLTSTQHPPAVQHCRSDQFTCYNGQCISKTFYCDGKIDCPTGEDEYCAPASSQQCQQNEFQCRNNRCVDKLWRCDGEDDCGDHSDEEHCRGTQSEPGSGSSVPKILPSSEISVRIWSTANLSCEIDSASEPVYTYWSRGNNAPLKKNHYEHHLGFFIIYRTEESDAGQYICTAESEATGAVLYTKTITLKVTNGPHSKIPTISANDRYQTVMENTDVELKCSVNTTSSDYRITWTRESSAPLPSYSQEIGETLRLFSLKQADSDRYKCRVISSYGENEDAIVLQVKRIVPIP